MDHASTRALDEWRAFRALAESFKQQEIDVREFARAAEQVSALLAALPPAYARSLSDIVTRFESAALFAAESCSFSHTDLHAALAIWLEKAGARLAASSERAD